MSLFSAKEWWSAKPGSEEEFAAGGMCLGNIINVPAGSDQIITGSLHGVLRVYAPSAPSSTEYKIEDLLLEKELGRPILQIEAGRFSSAAKDRLTVAVLHPHHLAAYELVPVGGTPPRAASDGDINSSEADGGGETVSEGKQDEGKAGEGKRSEGEAGDSDEGKEDGGSAPAASHYRLSQLYEHALGLDGLHFTASCMVHGPFGGTHNGDYACVQSMDGQLAFFEQEHFAFTRRLENCLLPGPVAYVPRTDSFVTCNARMELESYTYHAVSSADSAAEHQKLKAARESGALGDANEGGKERSMRPSGVLTPSWTLNIGEHARSVCAARLVADRSALIVVLGERTLFLLSDAGEIVAQKRLEHEVGCLRAYCAGGRPRPPPAGGRSSHAGELPSPAPHGLVASTRDGRLMVYSCRPTGVDTSDDAAIAAALQLQADAEQKALRARQAASELAAAGLSSGRSKEAAEAAEAAAAEAAIAAVEAATKRDDRAAASGVVRFSGLGDVDATGRRLTRAEKDAITGGSGAGAGSRVAVRLAWSARAVAGAGGRGASGPERGGAGAVALEVGRFAGLRGLVASLDEAGGVRVSYLGTSPPSDAVGAFAEGKALDYDSMDAEHRALLAEIRRSQTAGGGGGGGVSEPRDRLVLRAQVPTLVALADPGDEADDGGGGRGGPRGGAEDEPSSPAGGADGRVVQVAVRLYVSYTGSQPLRDVSLAISAPHGVLTVPASRSVVLSRVKGGGADPVVVPLLFRHAKDAAPTSTTVRVCAAFASAGGGEPRTAECAFRLPLCLFCRAAPPIKSSAFKITLDASCVSGGSGNGRTAPIPAIDALFADMLQQPDLDEDARRRCARSAGSVLTLVLRNGVDCTVLGSKSKGGRFRVQSSRLDGLLLVASELIRRLEDGGGDGIEVRYSDPLPLADFFAHVDEHFAARAALAEQRTALEDRAHQLRVIQKRMLLRFKDKNSPPLNGLDVLLDGTLQQLVAMGREMEGTQRRLASKARQLSATTRLLQLLTKHRFGLTDAEADVFASVVSADVDDNAEQGWEERTDAAVTHCLRTTLAKVAKETTGAAPPPLAPLKKTSKFKKHITILCDRLRKGAKLIPPPKPKTKKKALPEL